MDGQIQTPAPKPSLLTKIHTWSHRHKSGLLFAAALAIIFGSGIAVLAILYQAPVYQPAVNSFVPAEKKEEPKFYSPLTGLEVPNEPATQQQVTAIMLENSPDARPQSGIKSAGIVYEAIAEGGITRFLALYQESRPQLIGPVRSLRPYYVDWLASYDASVAHVGGSKAALDEVRNGNYKDIDQFFNAGAYWRATDRYAPHNVYASFDKLDALNTSKGYTKSIFTGFIRKSDEPSKEPTAKSISVNISGATYNSSYLYNSKDNSYTRSQGGAVHTDREAGDITPKVVVVIKVPTHRGFEDGYREQMQTIGSGQAYIFQDGIIQEATWTKPNKQATITFLDANNKELKLNAGQTWITAIPTDRSVTWQ